MKKRFFMMLLLMLGCVQTWAELQNKALWPNYTAIAGTEGVNTDENYPKLLDNNTGTKWCVTGVSGAIHIDIDATRPIKPIGYVLTTGNDTGNNTGRNPKSWKIYWSDDKANWTQWVSVSDGGMPTGNFKSKEFEYYSDKAHRYWRFEVTALVDGTIFQLSEFSFLVDYTNLKHVFVEGLEDTYYLNSSQNSINPQLTVRDLKGQTLPQNTYWKVGYYTSNNQYLSSVTSPGNYRLVISPGSETYYSDSYEYPITVIYGLNGSGTQSDPYTISSIYDWNRLVNSLNAGKTYAGQYVSLQSDLDLNLSSPEISSIMTTGNNSHVFSGTFLGNNHTITQTASYDNVEVCGLFRWVNGAKFQDLTVAGSLTSSRKFMAAIVGEIMKGDVTFDNCHVTADLTSTVNGDGTSGAFVGYQAEGTATFRNCSFTGSFIGPNTSLWGGMLAWGEGGVKATFSNCIFAPTTVNIQSNSGSTYARGRSTNSASFTLTLGEGCYCTHQFDTAQGTLVYAAQQEGINKLITAADGNLYHMTCTVSGVQSQYTYSGEPVFPEPTVTAIDAERLTEGTDYMLTYSDPTGRYPGQQSVTITATGETYVGEKTITYTLVRDPELPELQMGDVNYDDRLSVADVTTIINMTRGATAENDLADVDGDGEVTTTDAGVLVAIMLGKPYNIVLSSNSLVMKAGETKTLTATLTPAGEHTVTWTTSDEQVATVSDAGVVTAVGSGQCEIIASCSGLTATCLVGTYSSADYVDLGLPSGTLWAKVNVGATEPKGYGSYFAWGETEPKESYSWDNYFDCNNGSHSSFIKYNAKGMTLQPEDDAATANWGAAWQMPSKAEMEELFNSAYTTYELETIAGYKGFRITSKVNGNSIFLPSAGYNYGTYITNANYELYYWTRVSHNQLLTCAFNLYGNVKDMTNAMSDYYRYYGMPVRPVVSRKATRLTSIQLSKTTATIGYEQALQLTATLAPADAETKTLVWTTSDAAVATVSADGYVEGVAPGTCTITATTTDGSNLSASCTVTVAQYASLAVGDIFYSDGTFSSTLQEGKTPIGVIAYVGSDVFSENGVTLRDGTTTLESHGLVLSLRDVGSAVTWNASGNTYLKTQFDQLTEDAGDLHRSTDVSGYSNCRQKANADDFYACYQTWNYDGLVAPASTTGWFLPTAQQWVKMLEGLGELSAGDIVWQNTFDIGCTSVAKWEAAMAKVGAEGTAFDGMTGKYYWSSSEATGSTAVFIAIRSGVAIYYNPKGSEYHYLRPVLAF